MHRSRHILYIAIGLLFSSLLFSDEPSYGIVLVSGLHMRESPDTQNSEIVGQTAWGNTVKILEIRFKDGESWAKIESGDHTGWAHMNYIGLLTDGRTFQRAISRIERVVAQNTNEVSDIGDFLNKPVRGPIEISTDPKHVTLGIASAIQYKKYAHAISLICHGLAHTQEAVFINAWINIANLLNQDRFVSPHQARTQLQCNNPRAIIELGAKTYPSQPTVFLIYKEMHPWIQ